MVWGFPTHACTLFAAAGSSVQGGGVLIAKNRDREPLRSALQFFAPRDGFKHLGLVTLDTGSPPVAGINEKGLVVVDASPSCLAQPQGRCGAVAVTQTLLTRCASVDEVLAQKELFTASYPVFELVADRQKVAWIEVAPEGLVAVKVSDRGTICHTNHYQDPQLQWANQQACVSSRVRYRRIEQLLARREGRFTFADFLVFSQDRHAGPDNSLNRLGGTPAETRTLATFVVHLSANAPHLFVRMSNPGEPDKIVNFLLESPLWKNGLPDQIF